VAIIGSGPSGFYAAESLFRREGLHVRVDMFDRLPTPFGLVRYGVAPDHQKMKAVIRVYEKTAAHPAFRFFGNVQLGRDVTVADLHRHYDQIVYAYGSETDRRLGVPGEDLEGVHGATAFVGWYNGHPDYRELRFDLSTESVAVFGVGNVAMDVARVLLRGSEELASTDIADYALDALRASRVREVMLFGRRGAAQAAFSPKEIEEVGELDGVDLVVEARDLDLDEADEQLVATDTNVRKNVEYLRSRVGASLRNERAVRLRFLASPVEIVGEEGRVTGVRVERNRLVRDESGWARAEGTGEFEVVPAGLVLRAIGYRGVPVPGVPFDERRGIVSNRDGRVTEPTAGTSIAGEYVVGWAKRGPTGLIGTNRGCSADTVARMLEDLPSLPTDAERPDIEALLRERGVAWVSFDAWRVLDRVELERGSQRGKVRDKLSMLDDMLAAIDANRD
jgi:ferredoxin--NADP+ reductase